MSVSGEIKEGTGRSRFNGRRGSLEGNGLMLFRMCRQVRGAVMAKRIDKFEGGMPLENIARKEKKKKTGEKRQKTGRNHTISNKSNK